MMKKIKPITFSQPRLLSKVKVVKEVVVVREDGLAGAVEEVVSKVVIEVVLSFLLSIVEPLR